MKGISIDRPPHYQAGVLLAMMFLGFFIAQIIAVVILMASSANPLDMDADPLTQPVWALQTIQFASSVCTFLLPAFITAWLCSNQIKDYLSIRAFPDMRLLAVVSLATLLLSPTV